MNSFSAKTYIIGVNPYVLLPAAVLNALFLQAGKNKSPIQVRGTIDGHPFKQTLVKYSGKWRLYLNTPMRKVAGKEVGDTVRFTLQYDPADRSIEMHPKLEKALQQNKQAKAVLDSLPPSRQKEVLRYINALKTEASVDRNIQKAVNFLLGNGRFIGRDNPL